MAKWKYQCELNQAISKINEKYPQLHNCPDSTEVPKDAREVVVAELKKAAPLAEFEAQILATEDVGEFNVVLEKIHEKADKELVWCGL